LSDTEHGDLFFAIGAADFERRHAQREHVG
jgi:hypothetical protein